MVNKKIGRVLAVVLSAAMASSMAGCGNASTASSSAQPASSAAASTAAATSAAASETQTGTAASGDIVKIKWVQVGSGMPANYDAWQANLNKYLEEKIGVDLDVEVVSWGDWGNKRSAIVNTNGDYDILFTNSDTYTSDVNIGAFMDISDLLKSDAPDLYKMIPEEYWKAVQVNGKIYAVPTYKDSSMTQYFVWDKNLAEKYGIDYAKDTTLDSLTDGLQKMKDGEGKAPFVLNTNGLSALLDMNYDSMCTGLPALGVKYGDSSKKVVSVFEQDDIMSQLKTLHDWYKKGIINSDAATLAEVPAYRSCGVAQGWSQAAQTTWGPGMGVEAAAVQWGKTVVSNSTVGGSLSCISASCAHPDKALALLQLVNTDTKVRDALYYGLEGDNFEYTADNKVKRLNNDWTMAGYTQGTFFNVSQLEDDKINQWDEVKKLNESAEASPVIGISIDTTDFQDELANCVEIYNRYKSELLTGTSDPEKAVPEMMKEMRDAGFDTIIQKVQAQVDAAK